MSFQEYLREAQSEALHDDRRLANTVRESNNDAHSTIENHR